MWKRYMYGRCKKLYASLLRTVLLDLDLQNPYLTDTGIEHTRRR